VTREEIEAVSVPRESPVVVRMRLTWAGSKSGGEPYFRAQNGHLFSIHPDNIISIELAKPEMPDGWVAEMDENGIWSARNGKHFAFVWSDGRAEFKHEDGLSLPGPLAVANALMKANGWA